jgi:cbb3-type cytochrome oxidase maturation protein
MSVIYIVLPLALVLGGAALAAFLWAVQKGQFEDLETPALRLVLEDDVAAPPSDTGASVDGAEVQTGTPPGR